ncbi:hypothetical protein Q7P36_007586 [Cladosporium allicinum]
MAAQLWNTLSVLCGTAICSIISYAIYNIHFHPLRHFPGPLLWGAIGIPRTTSAIRGRLTYDVAALHRKYGTVVRVAPNDLAFADPQAWQDIYGLQPGRVQNRKDVFSYPIHDPAEADRHIIFGGDVQHARIRRLLAPGFTTSAVKDLAPMIESYADLLVRKLGEFADGVQVVDMSHWFEWATFDIGGEFAFGESFKCLESGSSNLFVRIMFESVELSSVLGQLERYKIFTILQMILPKSAFKAVAELDNYVAELSKKRQARGHSKDGTDMFNYLLENKGDDVLSQKEYEGNALTLLFAGADTTATVMIFGSYLLCKNPDAAKRARGELRSAFRQSSDINATNVNELKYMIAVLSEIMRLYPPGPSGLARHITNKVGQMVAGQHVPYNTSCAVYQLAANRLDINFARANEFLPERWLDNAPAEFAHDRRDIYQPFSVGPRNCIGKPIAYMEMRVLMAKFLYNFEFELAFPDEDWVSTKKAYGAWNNSELKMRLRAVAE